MKPLPAGTPPPNRETERVVHEELIEDHLGARRVRYLTSDDPAWQREVRAAYALAGRILLGEEEIAHGPAGAVWTGLEAERAA